MKNRLLLFIAIISMLICVLAISVSADSINPSSSNEYGELTIFDDAIGNTGISQNKDDGTIARAVMFDGTNYYTVPTTYILTESPKNQGGKVGEMLLLSFNELNSRLGKSFNKNSIIRFEFPSEIAFICRNNENLNNCNNVVEIIVNNGLRCWENTDQMKAFTNCKKLISIDISGMVIEYPKATFAMFEYCESLEYVKMPEAFMSEGVYLDYDTSHMFSGCKKLEKIENLASFTKGMKVLDLKTFYNCYVLENVVLWDGLEKLNERAFGNCKAMTEFIFPDTVTVIGTGSTVFESCTSLKKLVLPKGPVSIGNYAFEKCTALTDVWMPQEASTFSAQVFGQCGSSLNVTFYFSTPNNTVTVSNTTNNKDPYITAINTPNDSRIVYNAPLSTKCTVFYGEHNILAEENDCTKDIICARCKALVSEAYDSHDAVTVIEYANGFLSIGYKKEYCQRCAYSVEGNAPIMLECAGFSSPENGRGGIVISFAINKSAMLEYTRANNVSFTYGVFAVAKNNLGDNNILNDDGSASDYVVKRELKANYGSFDFKLSGFETEAQKSAQLAIGMYMIDNNGKIIYLQAENPKENEKYSFISYNDLNATEAI